MIDAIDPAKLPATPCAGRATLPEITAVYFALSESGDVLYISMALNLRRRWPLPHLLQELKEQCSRLAWLECSIETIEDFETVLIARFRSPLNKQ